MSEKRFFTKINKNGRNVIIDKECHIELIDLTLACDVLNRLDLKLKHYNEVNGEQQATISALHEENISLKESQDGKRRAILWWEHYKEKWVNAEKKLKKLKEENEQLRTLLKERQYEKDIAKCREENEQLQAKLREKEQDEQLYADEIVKLNKEAKEVLDFKNLGGDY